MKPSPMDGHPNIRQGINIPIDVPKLTLGQFLFAKLKSHNPYDVRMIEAETGRLITPIEFLSLSVRVAEGLKRCGLQQGDVVSIIGKAKIDVYATATGTLFQGGVVSPIDHNLPPDVFLQILKTTSPRFVFCDSEISNQVAAVLSQLDTTAILVLYNTPPEGLQYHSEVFVNFIVKEINLRRFRPVPSENTAESLAFLVCSSGTMGIPKPVKLTDRNLLYQATVWGIITSFNKLFRCPAISFSYFFWISGILVYMMVICMEFEMTIVQKLEGRHVLEVIQRRKPVWGMFSPALVKLITWQPDFKKYDVSSLLLMITGGTSLQKSLAEKVKELWGPQLSCRQSYGITEVSGSATASSFDDDVLSVGSLLPGFQMKIVSLTDGTILGPGQEGEIYLKSPSIMQGYLGNDEATKEAIKDGWYKTGDVGRYNEKGQLYIMGRVKDFFRVGDTMVSPMEIEEVVLGITGVADAGVVCVAAEKSVVVGLVVRAPGSTVTEAEIMAEVSERLPESKRIGRIFFVEFLPRTPSGKMKRVDLALKAKSFLTE